MKRADFMTSKDKEAMGKFPRTHQNCLAKTGKARPGKTAQERARKNSH